MGRYSFIVSDLHRLLLAGLSGALRKILDTTNRNSYRSLGSVRVGEQLGAIKASWRSGRNSENATSGQVSESVT